MKICFIIPSLAGGGMESLVSKLSNYFVSQNHDVTILLLFRSDEKSFPLDDRIEIVKPRLERSRMNRYVYALRLIPYIRKQLAKINPDTIVSHGEWSNAYIVLATFGLKYPLFLEDHMNPNLNLGFILNTAKRLFYRYADGIITLSEHSTSVIKRKTHATNIAVIPNPVIIKELKEVKKTNTIVCVGRLSAEKGHKYLIEAFEQLKRKDWLLEIVGDGIERESLVLLAEKSGMRENIVFHGFKSDFSDILSKSEIFVLPSLSEAFPLALIEAMAVPLACISSDCLAGNDIIIRNGVNGILVKPGDSADLAEALLKLMDNNSLRKQLSQEAINIRETLNIERVASKYLAFIGKYVKEISDPSLSNARRICFISAGLAGGGMERALTGLANYFDNKGYEVCIINLFRTQQLFSVNKSIKIMWPGVERQKYHRLIYALLIIPYVRRNIRHFRPDAVLSYGEWFNSYVILVTRFMGIPVYISDRMGPELDLGFLLETSRKILYRFSEGIIAQTNTAADILHEKTKSSKIKVIPNPVQSIDTDVSIKKKQIISVGRLSKEKGHIVLIQAFALLKQKEWTLHIVGEGKERNSLEREARRLGLADRIKFHGYLKNPNTVLGESSIFVLPSFYEGFPNALIEAMSVPLACISSNCVAGPSDIIVNNQNGILIPPGDVDILAGELNRLVEDDKFRQYLKGNAYKIREKLKFEIIAEEYCNFIFK